MNAHDASPAVLEVRETDTGLLLSWDRRRATLQFGSGCRLLAFFIPWTLITLCFTLATLVTPFYGPGRALLVLLPVTPVLWVVTISIGRSFFDRRAQMSVEITSASLTWTQTGRFSRPGRTIPLAEIAEIFFGYPRTASQRDRWRGVYGGVGLIVVHAKHGFVKKIPLDLWLKLDLQRQIYDQIQAFVEKRQLPLRMAIYRK